MWRRRRHLGRVHDHYVAHPDGGDAGLGDGAAAAGVVRHRRIDDLPCAFTAAACMQIGCVCVRALAPRW